MKYYDSIKPGRIYDIVDNNRTMKTYKNVFCLSKMSKNNPHLICFIQYLHYLDNFTYSCNDLMPTCYRYDDLMPTCYRYIDNIGNKILFKFCRVEDLELRPVTITRKSKRTKVYKKIMQLIKCFKSKISIENIIDQSRRPFGCVDCARSVENLIIGRYDPFMNNGISR